MSWVARVTALMPLIIAPLLPHHAGRHHRRSGILRHAGA